MDLNWEIHLVQQTGTLMGTQRADYLGILKVGYWADYLGTLMVGYLVEMKVGY